MSTLLLMISVCYAQERGAASANENELLSDSLDEVIKKEMAVFSLAARETGAEEDSLATALTPFSLLYCTDSVISFGLGRKYSIEWSVSIWTKETATGSAVKSIHILHYKYMLTLPDSILAGLHDPDLCLVYHARKKPGTSNCKVFRSKDRRRLYIYMLNGKGAGRYETTLILNDMKYYKRVMTSVPEV